MSIASCVLGLLLITSACGNEESTAARSTASEPNPSTTPVATGADTATTTEDEPELPAIVTDQTNAEVEIESIERIIPLDGTVAEVVFALGLGDKVVATDLSATYPAEADALPEIGYQRSLAAETIASFAPTVLIGTDIAGPPEVLDDLRRLGYPVVIVPNESTPQGPAEKIRAVAAALGVSPRGEELAAQLELEIADNTHEAADGEAPVVVALYLRGSSTQLVLGQEAATHWLIEAAGGVDGALELQVDDASPIAPEALLALAPDVILVPSAGLESVGGMDGLLEVGGIGQTPAGRNGNVLTFDDQLLLGNGPRTGRLLADLREALSAVELS